MSHSIDNVVKIKELYKTRIKILPMLAVCMLDAFILATCNFGGISA